MPADRTPRFKRNELATKLPAAIFNEIVSETKDLLDRRFESLTQDFDDISKTNFNPFLLLITAPVYNIFSPFEVAERLQLAKAFHGDDTAFGKFAEDRILPLFGSCIPDEKTTERSSRVRGGAASSELWTPVDCNMVIEGKRHLFSVKSGPWTMNQDHANAMIDKFPRIHEATGANIFIGITYGRYSNLNNKPELVASRMGHPEWFDYLVGRDFWEYVSGVRDVHKHVFKAIRKAQKVFADEHKDTTFHEHLVSNRLKIAASLRKSFNVDDDEDFWETLFNNMF
ncbi:MAG: PmeII family type II restriction endonuclease [Acidobacteriota bacterium]